MKSIFLILFFALSSWSLWAQSSLLPLANSMSKENVWTSLQAVDAKGETVFGKCRLSNAQACSGCACAYYFVGTVKGTLGHLGWGKNPVSGDGTGCVSWKSSPMTPILSWNSTTGIKQDPEIKQYVKNILINALENNVCTLPTPPNIKGGISILDTSKFLFVNPKDSCANGKILCGTTNLGGKVGNLLQFIKLSPSICKAAWGTAIKARNNTAKIISCSQYEQQALDQKVIQEAALMVGQMSTGYGLFEQEGMVELLQKTKEEYEKLPFEQVAIVYLLFKSNSNLLPEGLKNRVNPSKLSVKRIGPTDPNHLTQDDIDKAKAILDEKEKGVIKPKTVTLEQAVELCRNKSSACGYSAGSLK